MRLEAFLCVGMQVNLVESSRVALIPMLKRNITDGQPSAVLHAQPRIKLNPPSARAFLFSLTRVSRSVTRAHVGRFLVRLTPTHLSPPPPASLHRQRLGTNPSVSPQKLVACTLSVSPCPFAHHHRLPPLPRGRGAPLRPWIVGQVGASTPNPHTVRSRARHGI